MRKQRIFAVLFAALVFTCCPAVANAADFSLLGLDSLGLDSADIASIQSDSLGNNAEATVGSAPVLLGDEGAQSQDLELYADSSTKWVSPLTGVDVGTKGVYVAGYAELDQPAVYQSALSAVISWRKDALNDTSIKFKYSGTWYTVREYLKKIGMSESTYLNPQWSNFLERIAIQRAIECCISFDHTRPDGSDCFTATVGDFGSEGEVIAAGSSTISGAINLWASEKSEYVKEVRGQSHGVTGHYVALIDPSYTYYGFAGTGGAWAGEVASGSSIKGGTSPTNIKGKQLGCLSVSTSYASSGSWYSNEGSTLGLRTTEKPFFYCQTSQGLLLLGVWSSSNTSVATVDNTYQDNGYVTPVSVGTTTITLTSGVKTFSIDVNVVDGAAMYRLYNKWTGEHLYTSDANEKTTCIKAGWTFERVGWWSPASGTPVHRLYNKYAPGGEHHYTMDTKEVANLVKLGWTDEGVKFYSDTAKGTTIYREYNKNAFSNNHNYTADKNEHKTLVNLGWRDEGIGWYGVK